MDLPSEPEYDTTGKYANVSVKLQSPEQDFFFRTSAHQCADLRYIRYGTKGFHVLFSSTQLPCLPPSLALTFCWLAGSETTLSVSPGDKDRLCLDCSGSSPALWRDGTEHTARHALTGLRVFSLRTSP